MIKLPSGAQPLSNDEWQEGGKKPKTDAFFVTRQPILVTLHRRDLKP
jgi:hypothetical protein